jgi:hypothetical protein
MAVAALLVLGVAALSHVAPFPFVLDAASGKVAVWRMAGPKGSKAV